VDYASGMPPEQVAARIIRALKRGTPEVVIGWEARWILRFNRFFPRILDRLLARKVRKLYQSTGKDS
jgi:short-subunit dehydrogenase